MCVRASLRKRESNCSPGKAWGIATCKKKCFYVGSNKNRYGADPKDCYFNGR